MYGLIGKMRCVPGRRADVAVVLSDDSRKMPGCLSYIVAEDPADNDALWVTEVWDSEASHKASLDLPSVKEAIEKGRPLIAGFELHVKTRPVGGV
jgi:quinol monooxygenase YgiN